MNALALKPLTADNPELTLVLPHGQSFEDWEETGRSLASANKVLNWWIGDWWAAGSHRYGARAEAAARGLFGLEYQSLRDAAMVCRAFEPSRRRDNLSFTHHREVASLSPAKADALLDRAEREGWSTRDMRAEAALARGSSLPRWFEPKSPPTRIDRDRAKEAIFERLSVAASNGEICPTADELQEVSGVESVSTTVALMHILEREQRIVVQRFQKSRSVTIVATGDSTATPENQTPHWRDLPGKPPSVSPHGFAQRYQDKAQVIHAGARNEGKSLQEYLDECILLGLEVKEAMSDSLAQRYGGNLAA
jgi:hypothetical protein